MRKEAGKHYDTIAKKYDELYFEDFSDKKFIDEFLSLLPENTKILDIGCGSGQFTKYFSEKGFTTIGIDVSEEMLKIARKKVLNCEFKFMDMRELEFNNEEFDGLFVFYSLYHLSKKDVPLALKEFNRVLKPNGIIMLALQEGKDEKVIVEPLDKSKKIFVDHFETEEINNLLKKNGFQVLKNYSRSSLSKEEFSSDKIFVIARKL